MAEFAKFSVDESYDTIEYKNLVMKMLKEGLTIVND